MALSGTPISELQTVTYHMESNSVTCHPTQVNAPCLKGPWPRSNSLTQFL